jgi:hypothetical protein
VEKYTKALSHTEFLLDVELSGVPMTLNHYFNENLEKRYVSYTFTLLFETDDLQGATSVCRVN